MPLPERVVEDGFQLYQALFGPARQMQSYYGSAPAAKRFEVTLSERNLQLPEGVVRAWNGKIVRWGSSQQQEESFRGAALVDLPDGMKIRRTGVTSTGRPRVALSRSRILRNTTFWASPKPTKGSNAI